MEAKTTSIYDYDLLTNEVFYKSWHILEYIEKNPNMSDLDIQAIEATIMDALVSKKLIDPKTQSLDIENLSIVNNLEHYTYEKHPNISGIPLWMKEEFRKKAIQITGGLPISIYLARPASKVVRYCVYDPNTAVSAIFDDATFYNTIYTSPTRGVRLEEQRPFVEVDIDGELYLVDILTKRILKSSWFRETYDMEVKSAHTISKMSRKRLKYYKEAISDHRSLWQIIPFMGPLLEMRDPSHAEYAYEVEQSKKYFKEEWEKYEEYKEEMKNYIFEEPILFMKKKNKEGDE